MLYLPFGVQNYKSFSIKETNNAEISTTFPILPTFATRRAWLPKMPFSIAAQSTSSASRSIKFRRQTVGKRLCLSLMVIRFSPHDCHGTIQLLHKNKPNHLVRKSHLGKR